MCKRNLTRYFLVFLLILATTGFAYAQTAVDGAIGGTVEDSTGSAIPSATVTVRNNGTNATKSMTADASGYFLFIHLQPGTYTATISVAGFKSYSSTAMVEVGLLTDLEPKLPVGSSETTVEVAVSAPIINTTSPDFTGLIDHQMLANLPVNIYRWSAYSLLTPGVVADITGFGLLSFRGQSTIQNNVTFDGADDNQAYFGEERGRTRAGYSTPQYAIEEFQVNTSNYTSEYGRAVGGVVNSITKSGTNQLHGEAYFFDRDNEWGSKNPFVQIATPNSSGVFTSNVFKPKDWRKQTGIGIGGPIIKDKLFFFFAFDEYKRNFPITAVVPSPNSFFAAPDIGAVPLTAGGVPTVCGATGAATPKTADVQACTMGTEIYGSAAAATANYNTLSAPYSSGATATTPSYAAQLQLLNLGLLGPVARTGEQQIFFPKVDWQINRRNHATVEVSRLRWASPSGVQTNSTAQDGKASFGNDFVKLTFVIGKLDTVITNHLTNEIRYQYGRDFEFETSQTETPYEAALLKDTVGGSAFPPGVCIQSTSSSCSGTTFQFGTPSFLERAKFPDERRWQVADTANWTAGHHNIKFGIDFLNTTDTIINLRFQYGFYNYATLGNYFGDEVLASNPSTAAQATHYSTYNQAIGPTGFEFQTQDYGAFIEDQWKVTPRLSLTIGGRYDYEELPSPYANLVNPLIPQTASFHADRNNIGPRLGFSYDVFGTGKTVVRGGAGVFYGRILNGTIFSVLTGTGNVNGTLTGNPVSQLLFSFSSPSASGAPAAFPQVLSTAGGTVPPPNAAYFDPNIQNPYVYQADLSVQQDLGWKTVFSLSYLGALGRDLLQFRDTNLPTTSSAVPPTTVIYNVVDPTNSGPLRNGSTYTTKFYPKNPSAACALPTGEAGTSNRPNCAYGSITDVFSGLNSSYHALVVQLDHRMTRGLTFGASYTWSHALDFGENASTGVDINDMLDAGGSKRADYGNSADNVPNRFIFYGVYTTQWKYKGILGYLLNEYEIAPSFAEQNGLPYSYGTTGTPSTTTFTAAGTFAPIGSGVNGSGGAARIDILGRDTQQQPKTQVLDLRLSKHFAITERFKIELLGEAFNLMNSQNATSVQPLAYSLATGATQAANTLTFLGPTSPVGPFGSVLTENSNLAYSTRQLQLGARVQF